MAEREIILNKLNINNGEVEYDYSVCDELKKYFLKERFFIKYDFDLTNIPESIIVVPFVTTILPFVWMYDVTLRLSALDEDFYKSIPEFKSGYIKMYPEIEFKGRLEIENIEHNVKYDDKKASFFSGGVDAYATLLDHIDEEPRLITIHGADVDINNNEAWEFVQNAVCKTANEYDLNNTFIKSSFRSVLFTDPLHDDFFDKMHDDWWHGMQHGIGVIGHAAPVVWKYGISTLYIASSFTPEDGFITCASYPTIDNYVRFAGCKVVHDGFENSRQRKVHNIVDIQQKIRKKVSLRVCWKSNDGNNCNHCEKCYRTMMELYVEGANPNEFGFVFDANVLKKMKQFMEIECSYSPVVQKYWMQIKKRAVECKKQLKTTEFFKEICWIYKFDFNNGKKETIKHRLMNIAGKLWTVIRRTNG